MEGGAMGHQQLYWSHPRKFGRGSRSCHICLNQHGLILKNSLNVYHQCFQQYVKDLALSSWTKLYLRISFQ
uniref:Small ribosomal subunit protein uS14 n=1 Tax=Vombatus ursinus TaxID=29139 RepID=A0A4X2JXA0_VOMUR